MKVKRVSNKALLNTIKLQPCIVCGARPVDPSHIRSRGSGGPDEPFNVWPKCRMCHIQWGYGWSSFFEKHPHFWEKLEAAGWYIEDGKLRHKKLEAE